MLEFIVWFIKTIGSAVPSYEFPRKSWVFGITNCVATLSVRCSNSIVGHKTRDFVHIEICTYVSYTGCSGCWFELSRGSCWQWCCYSPRPVRSAATSAALKTTNTRSINAWYKSCIRSVVMKRIVGVSLPLDSEATLRLSFTRSPCCRRVSSHFVYFFLRFTNFALFPSLPFRGRSLLDLGCIAISRLSCQGLVPKRCVPTVLLI